MGTPNLPLDYNNPSSGKGVLFVATKGSGAYQVSTFLTKFRSTMLKFVPV